jgi:hypothetical protein
MAHRHRATEEVVLFHLAPALARRIYIGAEGRFLEGETERRAAIFVRERWGCAHDQKEWGRNFGKARHVPSPRRTNNNRKSKLQLTAGGGPDCCRSATGICHSTPGVPRALGRAETAKQLLTMTA